ncbi:hypothetical protein Pd630_LPD04728 [Rhodococcus opacus PD630]|nr:hypothetical protein Pd630_LPD04728 [Rhodococcus opacus PD630]
MTQQVSIPSLGTIPVTYTVEDRVGVLTIDNPRSTPAAPRYARA